MPPYDITRAMRGPTRFYQQGLRRSKTLLCLSVLTLLSSCTKPTPPAPAPPVVAAAAGPVGWIEGRVTASGKLPALQAHRVDGSLVKQCGAEVPDLSLVVGEGGALQYAVVSVDDAPASTLPANLAPALLDQKACLYTPPVVATRAGQMLKVRNSDPLLHNVRAMVDRAPIFNVMMPLENLVIEKKLPAAGGVVALQCDVHPWMHAWAVSFVHDLYAVTAADGRFRIDAVPVGRHPIKLWHPRLGEKRVELEIKANAGTQLELGWEVSDTPSP
jgi:hypothetical protein